MSNYNNGGKRNFGDGGSFDLSKYETVKSRKTRLRTDHPNALIYPMQISGVQYANHFVVHLALVWKDKATKNNTAEAILAITELCKTITMDNASIVASAIGLVLNADSVGHSLSIAGGAKADKNAWMENCEESAVGRALDNMGYHSGSASQEEMLKVQHTEAAQQERVQLENEINGMLMDYASRGANLQQLQQACIMSTKQFTFLHELTIDELRTVIGVLRGTPAA
ncbi:hypothetical protein SAMN02799624_05313 [Paenibacillus sp. UNC496MF]|uniref:hypothetical protein n=1 Tax=Paenibacillus sp. UNC496MF TaxID=1502753 RepID=UPI0008E9FEAA|nr:hypothetical protein [Paenibacillus sp. UNC496MF]SFJ63989.1 hypothetical protein SAMN02799624_05313 [Paenibacillus sp. UNC496MF]